MQVEIYRMFACSMKEENFWAQPYINPHLNKLIISNDTEQCTSKLCTSETSRGPDFANIADDTFCRMSDKSLWPICSP